MTHDEAWHERRKHSIGGSESPTILGVNPWETPIELWERKTGRRPDPEETPAMRRGTFLEPLAATIYQEQTGRKLRKVNRLLRHKDHPFLTGNIDRAILDVSRGPGILEVKCPGLQIFGKAKREGLPQQYNVQLQHYLAVARRTWGSVAIFSAERWAMLFFDVDRDQNLIDLIVVKDAEFYQCMIEDRPPAIDAEIPELPAAEPGELVTMDSPEWRQAVDRLREATAIRDEADIQVADAKQEIVDMMERHNAAVAEGAGARIYHRLQPGRVTIDSKRLQKEQPEVWAKYAKTGAPFRTFRIYSLYGGGES